MHIIAAGMPRAGSSWLYRNLSLHPHAGVSKLKEINFFSINHDRGYGWFDSLYNDKSCFARFDVSPFYFLDPAFHHHVKNSNLNTKIVIILREPNYWIRSLYYQIKSFTFNMPPFSDFIKEHVIKFDNRSLVVRLCEFDFLGRVNELASAFKGNLLLVNFDLIKNNPVRLLNEIEKFTNLPPFFNQANVIRSQVNASQSGFSWLYYISTNRFLRSLSSQLPLSGLIKFIQRKLYKEGQADLIGISADKNILDRNKYEILENEQDIDKKFPPVFKEAFFKESDIIYL
ncbi:sulfotransferase domain-containing protein [Aquicella lusitana]|uniref:Sulfotransferase domain-containing protein n=1 Tax=Aquicella lusitana TaxID=254246 RepID=A0A370G305_9COXI|nr:sulfotransferase domain-containing protein [Aquicella lusitana]RDI36443.1 sulfotransferase domain-containing protein [Aquicella lusitana]VVC72807.1 hypothetical protein AQULUS_05310 [Aquicella lusitana]